MKYLRGYRLIVVTILATVSLIGFVVDGARAAEGDPEPTPEPTTVVVSAEPVDPVCGSADLAPCRVEVVLSDSQAAMGGELYTAAAWGLAVMAFCLIVMSIVLAASGRKSGG